MKDIQNKVNLIKPTREQIKPVFDIWNSDITSAEDFKTRVGKTRDYLREFDCKDIWKFKFINDNDKDFGTLVLEKSLFQLMSIANSDEYTTKAKEVFDFLKWKDFSPIKNLSQEGRRYLEVDIIGRLSDSAIKIQARKANVNYEERFISFIETVGLFKDLSEENTLDFAKNVVTSNSTYLIKWLFSRGLTPDTMVNEDIYEDEDKWPLASFSQTMDMLNIFISHGANLTLSSKNGVPFRKLIFSRIDSNMLFATQKNCAKILDVVFKAEAATQATPQEHLWKIIKEAEFNIEVSDAIRKYENACDLRDTDGRHIVQFAMIYNPFVVNTILSVNKKTLALASTPDSHGRLPSIYWIASHTAQESIQKKNKTTMLIPKKIDEEAWRQAARLTCELNLRLISLCSDEVKRKFKRTTGKNLDEWIEEEAKNGSQWFEHIIDIAVKRAKKGLPNIRFFSSDVINIWSDPDNNRVVNSAHALFRAHLMLSDLKYDDIKKQNIKEFFKTHLSCKTFNTLKNQINNGVSFMKSEFCKSLAESLWWMEICAIMEREGLLKKHVEAIKTITVPSTTTKFNAL